MILFFIGLALSAFGFGLAILPILAERKESGYRKTGIPVETEVLRITVNTNLTVLGNQPYRIITTGEDPGTAEIREYASRNIWFNPEEYLEGKKITVYVARNDIKNIVWMFRFFLKMEAETTAAISA